MKVVIKCYPYIFLTTSICSLNDSPTKQKKGLRSSWECLLWCMLMKTIKTGLDSVRGQKWWYEASSLSGTDLLIYRLVHLPQQFLVLLPMNSMITSLWFSLWCTDDQPHRTKESVSYAPVKWMENIMLQWPLWFEWDGLVDRWYEN